MIRIYIPFTFYAFDETLWFKNIAIGINTDLFDNQIQGK